MKKKAPRKHQSSWRNIRFLTSVGYIDYPLDNSGCLINKLARQPTRDLTKEINKLNSASNQPQVNVQQFQLMFNPNLHFFIPPFASNNPPTLGSNPPALQPKLIINNNDPNYQTSQNVPNLSTNDPRAAAARVNLAMPILRPNLVNNDPNIQTVQNVPSPSTSEPKVTTTAVNLNAPVFQPNIGNKDANIQSSSQSVTDSTTDTTLSEETSDDENEMSGRNFLLPTSFNLHNNSDENDFATSDENVFDYDDDNDLFWFDNKDLF